MLRGTSLKFTEQNEQLNENFIDFRKEIVKHQTPSPAVYPLEIDRNAISKYETLSIYPKDNGYKFSIGGRR